eukprot:jgi/Mesvir1/11088/Mv02462-RA.1
MTRHLSTHILAMHTTSSWECLDDATGNDQDAWCNSTFPFCIDGACSVISNPSCTYSGGGSSPATCPTDLQLQYQSTAVVTGCNSTTVDSEELKMEIAGFTQLDACKFEVSVESGGSGRRHLLQSVSDIIIALKVYVDDPPQGNALLALLTSTSFGTFLASYFNVAVGAVQTVTNINAVFLALSSATSDPHFTTAQGHKFDFNGKANSTYCIVTDQALQVNARFTGATNAGALPMPASPSAQTDTRTWMDQVGILVGGDRVLVGAESPPGANFANGFGTLLVNGG